MTENSKWPSQLNLLLNAEVLVYGRIPSSNVKILFIMASEFNMGSRQTNELNLFMICFCWLFSLQVISLYYTLIDLEIHNIFDINHSYSSFIKTMVAFGPLYRYVISAKWLHRRPTLSLHGSYQTTFHSNPRIEVLVCSFPFFVVTVNIHVLVGILFWRFFHQYWCDNSQMLQPNF